MSGPWTWKMPVSSWFAYWLHDPPAWIFRAYARLPRWLRFKLADWAVGLPGVCGASLTAFQEGGEIDRGSVFAHRCAQGRFPCWCMKYQTRGECLQDVEKIPEDPFSRLSFRIK